MGVYAAPMEEVWMNWVTEGVRAAVARQFVIASMLKGITSLGSEEVAMLATNMIADASWMHDSNASGARRSGMWVNVNCPLSVSDLKTSSVRKVEAKRE